MADFSSIGGAAGGLLGGPIGAGIGSLAGGLLGAITGAGQKNKAHNLLNSLQFPNEQIPYEVTQAASEGLPSEQYNLAMKNIQRQQNAAISNAQDRRGGLATIAKTQQISDDAMGSLDAKNAEARMQNQKALGNWRDKVWDNNVKQKYIRDYNYAQSLLGAGNVNFTEGLDKGIAGVGLLGYGGAFNGKGGGSNSSIPNYATGVPDTYSYQGAPSMGN